MRTERVSLDVIDVSSRLRPLNEAAVTALVGSIKLLGQLQHISLYIRSINEVIPATGAHRIKAAKRLGWYKIEAVLVVGSELDRELQEIAENLHRAELTVLERDTQIARWAEVLAAKERQVDAPSGGAQPADKGIKKAARDLNISEPDARRAVKVASISDKAKQAARDAGLDDNRTALLEVAKEPIPEAQVAKIAEIAYDKAAKASQRQQPRATSAA